MTIPNNLISLPDVQMQSKFIGEVSYGDHTGTFSIIPDAEYPQIEISNLGRLDLLRYSDDVYVRSLNIPNCEPYMGYVYIFFIFEVKGYYNVHCRFNGKDIVGFGSSVKEAETNARKIITHLYID